MIGKYQITIDASDFIKGMSTSSEIADAGFSPDTTIVNLTATPGVLYAPIEKVSRSTNLLKPIIAIADDPYYLGISVSGNLKMALDEGGNFYRWDGTTLTLRVTDSTSTYSNPTTMMVPFKGYWYASQANGGGDDITRFDGTSTLAITWWSSLVGGTKLIPSSQRPLLVYESNLWIADTYKLHKFDGSAATSGKLTLDTFTAITALGTDPGSGYMLIGAQETGGANGSATKNGTSKILIYDGYSDKPLRSVIVDGMVTAFYSLGGQTYVFYGNKMGVWNGAGITFLRKLNVAFNGSQLVFPHRVTSIDNTLYYADGQKIIAYGEVLPGRKVFYPAQRQDVTNNQTISTLAAISNKNLGISWDNGSAVGLFYTFDTTSVATVANTAFYSNKYSFPRPVFIRGAYLEFSDAIATTVTPGTLTVYTEEPGTANVFSSLQNNSSGSVYSLRTNDINVKANTVKFLYSSTSAVVAGLRRIVINYDIAE